MVEIKIDTKDFEAALYRLKVQTGKEWPQIIRSEARLVAVELANRTQPFGNNSESIGKNSVEKGIRSIFKDLGDSKTLDLIERSAGPKDKLKKGESLRTRIERYLSTGNKLALNNVLKDLNLGEIAKRIGDVERAWHKQHRDPRTGRVRASAQAMRFIQRAQNLTAYIKRTQKAVGWAKSGWATCARILGGTRNIPGWVSRKPGPGTVQDFTSDQNNPRVIITNEVSYIDRVCPPREIANALRIQAQKMVKRVEIMVSRAGKTSGFR